jgi:uncharacterized membrane protein (UPF0136 family)
VLAITGREERDDAFVIRRASAVMDLFVQLRDRGKNDREQERADASGGYDHSERDLFGVVASPAHVPGSVSPRGASRKRHSGSNWTPSPEWLTDAQHFMIGPAKIYFIVFGLLTIVGGVIGYVKAGSTISIISGAIAGIALIVAAFLLSGNAALGLIIAGVVSLLLAGRFIPHFMKSGKIMPDALMAALSAIGVVVAIVAWIKK